MTAPTHLSRMKGLTLPTGRTDMDSRTITTQAATMVTMYVIVSMILRGALNQKLC